MRLLDPILGLILLWCCQGCTGNTFTRTDAEAATAMPPSDAQQAIPDRFVVSTNEPFMTARVDGDVLLLTMPHGQRSLKIERNEAVFDGRVVSARDAAGIVELRVTERLCIDSMSGSQHPYTGHISVESRAPVLGCGGPLDPDRGQ